MPDLLVYAPAVQGGGPLQYLAHALPRIVDSWPGHVRIVTSKVGGEALAQAGLAPSVDVVQVPFPGGLRTVARAHRESWRLARRGGFDVVFCLGNTAYFGPRRTCVTLLQNAARLRDLRWAEPSTMAYFAYLRLSLWLSAMRSREVVAVSGYMLKISPRIARSKGSVVYHGINVTKDLEGDASGPADTQTAPPESPLWLLPGSIAPYKGIEWAIDALDDDLRARLSVVGPVLDGRYQRSLVRRARRRGVESRVHWGGAVSHATLQDLMVQCDILLITSRAEACPNVLLEGAALAPNRPIVGISAAWSREYADLFDVLDRPAALAASARRLAQQIDSAPSVVERRAQFVEGLTWDACAKATRQVLQRAASGNSTET